MRLKNVLIVVSDIERSKRFYTELFGLDVTLDQGETIMLTEGLVLQAADLWKDVLQRELLPKNHMTELYFEEADLDGFVKRLEASAFSIEFVHEGITFPWGQKMIRFYDPDGNLIEVRTPM